MNVVKRNKRLLIVDDAGIAIYCPPEFIHIQSRDQLRDLAEAIVTQGYIDAVMAFESRHARRRSK